MLEINEMKSFLPHRFPFLLVDRVIEIEKGRRAVGIKNITGNDFFNLEMYFNHDYLFPGALQVEAMAQMAGFIIGDPSAEKPGPLFLLASIDSARFRKPARPGDQLRIEVELKKFKVGTGKFKAKSYVDGETVSEVTFTCMTAPV